MMVLVGRWLILAVLVASTCFSQVAVTGQPVSGTPDPSGENHESQSLLPGEERISAAEIPGRARNLTTLLREIEVGPEPHSEVTRFRDQLPDEKTRIEELEVQTRSQLEHEGGLSALEDTLQQWLRVSDQLDERLDLLVKRVSWIDEKRAWLIQEKKVWENTLASEEQQLPDDVLELCTAAAMGISDVDQRLLEWRLTALTLQNDMSTLRSLVDTILIEVRAAINERRHGLFEISSPPLWNVPSRTATDLSVLEHIQETAQKSIHDIRAYIHDEREAIFAHALITLVLFVLIILLRRPTEAAAIDDESLAPIASLLRRPVASALLVSTLLDTWLHSRAPNAVEISLTVVLVVSMLRLLPLVAHGSLSRGPLLILGNYLFFRLVEMVPDGSLLYRLILIVLNVLIAWSISWFLRRFSSADEITKRWAGPVQAFARLGLGLLAVALVANIIGSVAFSKLLIKGVLGTGFLAILCWLGCMIVEGIIAASLHLRSASHLLTVSRHRSRILKTARTVVRAGTVLTWLTLSFNAFNILDWAVLALKSVMDLKLGYGDLTFDLGTVVLFCITIWASFKISAFLRFVLDEDVVPRVSMPRGVSAALSKGLHYTVLLVGFGVAAVAAGFDFSKIALVAGALGVGIGFGLQNVVNSFVSGLILLFERPIKVGDRVQLGELVGEVRDIGMRTSVIRTWQGAEVIVPNADLTSNQIINWTLSDNKRSAEVNVGVAYGSDVERVLELLVAVARAHPSVLDDPEPVALFCGFGDSSLDFELRCWTTEWFQRVRSEVAVGIDRALVEAGIEIPFPQRDVHVFHDGKKDEG